MRACCVLWLRLERSLGAGMEEQQAGAGAERQRTASRQPSASLASHEAPEQSLRLQRARA